MKHAANFKDITGQTFGWLKVMAFAGVTNRGFALWKCRCGCGREITANGKHLRRGVVKSCGCKRALKYQKLVSRRMHGRQSYSYGSIEDLDDIPW